MLCMLKDIEHNNIEFQIVIRSIRAILPKITLLYYDNVETFVLLLLLLLFSFYLFLRN